MIKDRQTNGQADRIQYNMKLQKQSKQKLHEPL